MSVFRMEVLRKHLEGIQISKNPVSYNLTRDRGILQEQERAFYEENGYLLVNRLVETPILEECRSHFHNICNEKESLNEMILTKEVSRMFSDTENRVVYNKIQNILSDRIFSKYTEHNNMLSYVESIVGPNIMALHSALINKVPGTSIYPPHQDLHYIHYRPANNIVASWTAIDPVFKDNGCLYVVPGSHKEDLRQHSKCGGQEKSQCYAITNYDSVTPETERVYLSMNSGDTILFHPLLIHGSGPNNTNNFRKAISCHYASSDSNYTKGRNANEGSDPSTSGTTHTAKHLRGVRKSAL